jgi:hypothetical protein
VLGAWVSPRGFCACLMQIGRQCTGCSSRCMAGPSSPDKPGNVCEMQAGYGEAAKDGGGEEDPSPRPKVPSGTPNEPSGRCHLHKRGTLVKGHSHSQTRPHIADNLCPARTIQGLNPKGKRGEQSNRDHIPQPLGLRAVWELGEGA